MSTLARTAIVLVFLGSVGAIVAANLHRDRSGLQFRWRIQPEVPLKVRLEPADRGDVIHSIEAPGTVEAEVEVDVSAEVVSRIIDLPIREGQKVNKGDLLVKLDSVDYEADVQSAQARVQRLRSAIEAAQADLKKAQRDVEQNQRLFRTRAVGATELADMETVLRKEEARIMMAQSELSESESFLAKSKENLLDTTIRSAIDGVVSRLVAEKGEVVVVGTMNNPGTVIMTVSDMNTIIVRARIDETDVPLVKEGQPAIVYLQYDEEVALTGSVKRISPKGMKGNGTAAAAATNTDVATFETLIAIDSPPPQIRLGMTANVEIQVDKRQNVLTIPSQAVLHRQLKDLPADMAQRVRDEPMNGPGITDRAKRYHEVVFVREGGLASLRLIKAGISDATRVHVLQGLDEGQEVVTGPYRIFDLLKHGKPIAQLDESQPVEGTGVLLENRD